jgi:hypothetical protein
MNIIIRWCTVPVEICAAVLFMWCCRIFFGDWLPLSLALHHLPNTINCATTTPIFAQQCISTKRDHLITHPKHHSSLRWRPGLSPQHTGVHPCHTRTRSPPPRSRYRRRRPAFCRRRVIIEHSIAVASPSRRQSPLPSPRPSPAAVMLCAAAALPLPPRHRHAAATPPPHRHRARHSLVGCCVVVRRPISSLHAVMISC